jgi:RNA polymerase sigma factor (sigma-70 family)
MTRELDEEILSTVRGMVVNLCHRIPHRLEHLEDAYQESLIKAWECLRRYDQAKNPSFWGFACLSVRGAAIDYFRKQKIMCRKGSSTQHMLSLLGLESIVGEDLSNKTVLMNRVVNELDRLPKRWRYVLERHSEGDLMREIGRELGVTKDRVTQIKQHAIKRLRVRLLDHMKKRTVYE